MAGLVAAAAPGCSALVPSGTFASAPASVPRARQVGQPGDPLPRRGVLPRRGGSIELEGSGMTPKLLATRPRSVHCFVALALAAVLPLPVAPSPAAAQQPPGPRGSIAGKVTDEQGAPVAGADVRVEQTTVGARTRADGGYIIMPGQIR